MRMKLSSKLCFARRLMRPFALALTLAAFLFNSSSTHAYYYFYVNDGAAQVALVAEQIVPVIRGGLDYQYKILNISPGAANIDGFTIKIGKQVGLVQQVVEAVLANGLKVQFPGKVVFVDPEVLGEHEYEVRTEVDNRKENGRLRSLLAAVHCNCQNSR
jgi:hypothetical protein